MIDRRTLLLSAVPAAFGLGTATAQTSAWPTHPITLVVPFPAGGALDLPARELAADLFGRLGQQIVIENPSGANGNIGATTVARAQPDGYTLLFASPGVLATNRFMYKSIPFDPDRAFTPVVLYGKSPLIIVANPKLPYHDLKGMVDYAKANPGKLNVGIPSVGSQAHLTIELLRKQSGITVTYVPYRGGANVNVDLMGGQIDVGINFGAGSWSAGERRHRCVGLRSPPRPARRGFPRRADGRGIRRSGLQVGCLVQRGRPRRNAAPGRRAAQRPHQRPPEIREGPPAARRLRHPAGRRNARGVSAPMWPPRSPNGVRSSRPPRSRCKAISLPSSPSAAHQATAALFACCALGRLTG